MKHYFWNTIGRNAGQIVEVKNPQVHGTAEGNEGAAEGIVLTVDHSDQTWTLSKNGKEYASGKEPVPTVEEAIKLWSKR